MSRLRSLSFPRRKSSSRPDDYNMDTQESSCHFTPVHSRDSSAGSTNSSPITPTFSTRGHTRWPSSTSSLVIIPDSPTATPSSKPTLDDLVEDPAERDESPVETSRHFPTEPLCICDTTFCEHRRDHEQLPLPARSPPEWSPGDDYFSDGHLPEEPFAKRRRSGMTSTNDGFASRISRRFSSLSKRFPAHRPSGSVSTTNVRSGPPSRASSLRLSATRSVTAPAASELPRNSRIPPSPVPTDDDRRSISPPRTRATSRATTRPLEIEVPLPEEDPIDREQLASTPLLPPMLAEYFNDSNEAIRSPLQSPTVAAPSAATSIFNTPAGTPTLPGFPTPPLSARPSNGSLQNPRSGVTTTSSEIPPLAITEENDDPWVAKLGHANFHITPEPYMPEVCDSQTCKRLADDWEAARVKYYQQAARISEHYGPTSQTYKLTEQKWAEIDALWRANHEMVNAEAQASGESPFFQPLAEVQPLSKIPSLNDPQQPSKFPVVDEKDIVGPMVRYAKIQHERKPSRNTFLKLFTDPASLLAGRRS